MDLMLNITNTSKKGVSSKQTKKKDLGGGFSMKFNSSQPVKAIVARKRAITNGNAKNSKESFTLSAKKREPVPTPNVVEFADNNPSPEKKKKKKIKSKDDSDIMLSNTYVEQPEPKKKKVKTVEEAPVPQKQHSKKKTESSGVVDFTKDDPSEKKWNKRKDKPFPKKDKGQKNIVKSHLFEHPNASKPEKVERIEVNPLGEKVFSGVKIDTLDIHSHSKKNVADLLHFTQLTVVQNLSIPKILLGKDVLIRSQTGSGKTLAYALPLVENMHSVRPKTSRKEGILAVIIVPTRELALQTYELFLKLLKPYTWIVSGYLCGGEKRKAEKARLRAGLNILIGTPGRFCDHLLHTESLKLSSVKYLVLDEADRLLELGYEKDVKKIVESINNPEVQTVLLSATLTASVKELAGLTLKEPTFVDTSDISVSESFDNIDISSLEDKIIIPSAIVQSYSLVPTKLRLVTLSALIASECTTKSNKVLVFFATQNLVNYHYDVMVEVLTQKILDSEDEEEDEEDQDDIDDARDNDAEGVLLPKVRFFKLHGKMTQVERNSVFKEFRKTKSGVLLCTDVAARGIDVPEVDLVIQYDPPQILSDYVHRVGRTARAGQKGKAVMFLNTNEEKFVNILEQKQLKIKEEKPHVILKSLIPLFGGSHRTSEYAAIELQRRFEQLVSDEKEIFGKACKAFVSWVKYYSNFPKDLREIFNIKDAHMGHYAKSMGLREPPKHFMQQYTAPDDDQPQNRLTEEDNKKRPYSAPLGRSQIQLNKRNERMFGKRGTAADFERGLKTSKVLNISEFDSGIPAKKKKK